MVRARALETAVIARIGGDGAGRYIARIPSMRPNMRRAVLALAWSLVPALASAAFTPPPRPESYATDRAGVLGEARRKALNERLAQFERETSNQVLVYVDRKLPADVTLEEFANRTFRAWKVGQKDKDNGVVFFAFVDDRKMRIEVGYGLEGVIPDARAKQITSGVVVPAFKKGDYGGGIEGASDALMKAARGEYQGTGATVAEAPPPPTGPPPFWIWILPLLAAFPAYLFARRGDTALARAVRASASWSLVAGVLVLAGGLVAGDVRIVSVAFGLVLACGAIAVPAMVGDATRSGRRFVGLVLVRAGLGLVLGTVALAALSNALPFFGGLAIAAILLGPPVLALGILLSFENPLRAATRLTVPIACFVCLACGAFFLLMLIAGSSGAWVPLVLSFGCGVLWIGGWILARAMGWRILPEIRFALSSASSGASSSDSWSSSSSSSDSSSWSSSSSSDSSFSGGGGDSGGGGSSDSW